MSYIRQFTCVNFLLIFLACTNSDNTKISNSPKAPLIADNNHSAKNEDSIRTIHVMVALCDNKYQGIVPVPAAIGNGQDTRNNLYWGAGYGIKSFFTRKESNWRLTSTIQHPDKNILERLVFRHRKKNIYLLADAYDGRFIQQTTIDFLAAAAGNLSVAVKPGEKPIQFGGAANLVVYVGHDGLMDFSLNEKFIGDTIQKRQTIILACYSKNFFKPHLQSTGAAPLLWTSGLMAPEAYTLYDAIESWVDKKPDNEIRQAAAKAYSKYQRCSYKAAYNLLVSGW